MWKLSSYEVGYWTMLVADVDKASGLRAQQRKGDSYGLGKRMKDNNNGLV